MENERSTMSDNQRRFVCRIVFLFLCMLPTSVAIYFILHQPGPEDWQRLIQAELGVRVHIDSVETPTPNITLLRGVRLDQVSQEDTGLDGRTIEQLAIVFEKGSNKVVVNRPIELGSEELTTLVRNCCNRLNHTTVGNKNWRVSFRKVALVDKEVFNTVVLDNVRLFIDTSVDAEHGVELSATILASLSNDENECDLELNAIRSGNLNSIVVDTNGGCIPSHMLRHFSEFALCLGSHCRFTGRIETNFYDEREDLTTGKMVGRFENVQLDQLAEFSGRKLNGTCDLEEINFVFQDGQLDAAGLRIVSDNAVTIESQLLDDAFEYGIRSRDDITDQKMAKLATVDFGIQVEDGQLSLTGPQVEVNSKICDVIAIDDDGAPIVICERPLKTQQFVSLVIGKEAINSHWVNLLDMLNRYKARPRLAQQETMQQYR